MSDNHVIEPIGISIREGKLHVEGYPTAKRVCKIPKPLAESLAALRLHEADLNDCHNRMQQLGGLGKPNENESFDQFKLREAIFIAILVKFYSCFTSAKSYRFPLSENTIYKKTPHALENFTFVKNLRNKHVVHDENNCNSSTTCAVFDENNLLIDIVSINARYYPGFDFYQNLFELIEDARKYVSDQIIQALSRLFDEVKAVSADECSQWPDLQLSFPTPTDLAKSRDY